MGHVTYKGAEDENELSDAYVIKDDDDDGTRHTLRKDVAAEVPEALAKELLSGSDRTKGHKFETSTDEEIEAAGLKAKQEETSALTNPPPGPSGPAPATPTGPGAGGGTASAAART